MNYFDCFWFFICNDVPEHVQKSFLQDVRHNLWDFDQDEDEVAVANYGSQIQEKYTAK